MRKIKKWLEAFASILKSISKMYVTGFEDVKLIKWVYNM
jgi:hypothetical protein